MRERAIDVSHWDGDVDYVRWRDEHELWGVIVKAGGNERGLGRYIDPMFEAHYRAAKDAGLHVGSYYYTVSTDTSDAAEDARHFASLLDGKQFDLPVYMDVEDPAQFRLSPRALTDVIKAFCDTLGGLGYKAGLYTGGSAWLNSMYHGELLKYANWIAWWRGDWPVEAGDIGAWQQGTMRLSDGAVYYDDVSGCTDLDWFVIDYPKLIREAGLNGYSREEGGTVTKLISYQDMIAESAEHYANHDAHGYSQINREGDGTVEELRYSDGTPMRIRGGDKDCSEMARACVAAAGLVAWDYWESYMWTENQYDVLTSHGFERIPFDWYDTRRGDILWVKGHTGVALGNGLQADAHGDEYGGIDGPNQGDQTGHEIEVRDLQWYWTWTYRYVGPERPQPKPKPTPEQHPGDKKNSVGIHYRAHCQRAGWLPAVRDGQTAGTEGYSARMEAIKISPPEGVTLDVMAHLQGTGDVWYRGVKNGERSGTESSDIDPIIGTVGESRRMEGIEIDVVDWPKKLKGKWLYYQLHLQGVGWTDPVRAGEYCGTRGQSRRAEAIRMWIA